MDSEDEGLKNENRTDRIVIAVALLIFLLAGGLFYFDDVLWGGRRARGERIGVVASREGDVRLKFEGEVKWSTAASGQDLVYNDAVYAGPGSRADLKLGDSNMTVTENTLIVLRRDQNVSFLNLNYGTLFGKIAKNEKIMIDTGNGKPIEFTSTRDSQIVLRRTEGKTRLDVTSGEAVVKVDGQSRKVDQSSRLVFGDKTPAYLQANHLRPVAPTFDRTIVSEEPTRIQFDWAWENGRAARPDERFTLEFASDPSFRRLQTTKHVQGATTTSMSVSKTLSLYWRVRAGNEVSAGEQVNFVRLEKPVIVRPLAEQRFDAPPEGDAAVGFEFQKPAKSGVWYQVARDAEFKQIVLNQSSLDTNAVHNLPIGPYYLRARSDFGKQHVTQWTDTRVFSVEPKMEAFRLSQAHVPARVVIPNRTYPARLYTARADEVKKFLADRGLLRKFFPYKDGEVDAVQVEVNGEMVAAEQLAWPADRLAPGRYQYRYQAAKKGFLPSEWSNMKKLEIAMEPPRALGEATFSEPHPNGARDATWDFTPLLFAGGYDVEVSPTPAFQDPLEFKTEGPRATTELTEGEWFWRVRARDRQGRIISGFSQPQRLKDFPAAPVPPMLAQNAPVVRKPAQERISTRTERVLEKPWERSGWWAWLGAGTNYVDYKQSVPSRGTLNAHNLKGPSQYFEGGYLGGNGVGGVLTYKNTPGEFNIPDVPVTPNSFRWTTMGLEAVLKKTSSFSVGDTPIVYGLRAGLQQHVIPFLFLPASADVLQLKNNQMTTASFGLLAEMARRRWTYYWLMRYQFPFQNKADGSSEFTSSPVVAVDGSLGTSYNITQQMKVGLFWYGQWHQFNFVYGDGEVTNTGFQSLFYSNVDLRLGIDF